MRFGTYFVIAALLWGVVMNDIANDCDAIGKKLSITNENLLNSIGVVMLWPGIILYSIVNETDKLNNNNDGFCVKE